MRNSLALALLVILAAWVCVCHVHADEPQAARKIKVGVIVSYYTATGPSWIGQPYGYKDQLCRIEELNDPDFELYPVIEKGTAAIGEMPAILKQYFPKQTTIINGYDADELKKLDVVFAHMIFNMKSEMSVALMRAVQDGLGYVQQSGGAVNPGYSAENTALAGMSEAEYGWNPHEVDCQVVGEHPLLGALSGDKNAIISLKPNGHFGMLTKSGIPLLRVTERKNVYVPRGRRVNADFYPLYVSQLGKGRIVGIGFAHYEPTPDDLEFATKDQFFIRCIQWAAGRELK